MFISKRKKYYRRCQAIIDDLHKRVDRGEYVNEEHCKHLYGTSDYNALLHELRLMNSDTDMSVMTPAMEWLYKSRHFKYKAQKERRGVALFIATILSVLAAGISAYFAGRSSIIENPSHAEQSDSYSKQYEREYERGPIRLAPPNYGIDNLTN